ncbi:MAG: hypothetical protein ACQKBT_08305 [Puniceicoccales bacterium]
MRISILLAAWVGVLMQAVSAETATSVSRGGITWHFDRPYEVGQFANGDWWVLGPVTITEIDPPSTGNRNGSMLNPVRSRTQGFDDRIQKNEYLPELNVATQLPLHIDTASSLLSSISLEADRVRDDPQLDTIAILTVLLEVPPTGSFRPPYIGSDKSIPGNVSDLDFSVLRRLPPVAGAPGDLVLLAEQFELPYIETNQSWTGRYMHPKSNQPTYGRELAHRLGLGMLALQLDYPDEVKKPLYINLVQIGIDIYGAARDGAEWAADGGHNQGRKMPMLLAGVALANEEILEYADAEQYMIFQEDQQTFYVTQSHVDTPRKEIRKRPLDPYTQEMIGMPEWGIRNYHNPERSGSNWRAYYRTVSGAPTFTHATVARLMGVEEIWNHPAFFDYYDRYWEIESNPETALGKGTNGIQPFTRNMWEAYVLD